MTTQVILGAPLGRWQTNCWVVGDADAGRAVVVDPGEGGSDHVPAVLDRLGMTAEAILLTHGHLDHVWAAPALARALDVGIHLHPADRWLWTDPAAGFGASGVALLEQALGLDWDPATDRLRDVADGDVLEPAGIRFRVDHNPGHTPGHVTYLAEGLARAPIEFALGGADAATEQVLFSGDLLFAGAIGRTDLPGGSDEDMHHSLARTVLPLDDGTLVLSGHGPDTTVGRERATNPFLARAAGRHRV